MHMNKILYICVQLGHLNESIRTIQLKYIVYFRLELLTGLVFAIVQSTHDEFWYNVSWWYISSIIMSEIIMVSDYDICLSILEL